MKSAAILDGLTATTIGDALAGIFSGRNIDYSRFRLPDLTIRPCRSCGSCGEQTPGRCVQKDDMESVYRAIGPSDMLVFMTDITFGGYSSQLKKAVDRLMCMGFPLYKVKKGHLVPPLRYTGKSLFVIGQAENGISEEDADNFHLLASRNSLNFQYPYRSIVIHPEDNIQTVLQEVLARPEKAVPY